MGLLKIFFYYFIILKIVGISLLIPFYLSPSAVILTLILLAVLVAFFLFNLGFILISVIYLIVYVGAVLVLYIFALSVLRERLYGFNFKAYLYFYFFPLYVFIMLLFQVLIIDSFENLDFFSYDFSKLGLSTGLMFYDSIFYNFIFSKYMEIFNIGILLFYKYILLFICCGVLLFIVLIGSLSVLVDKKK